MNKTRSTLLICLLVSAAIAAVAQYNWLDPRPMIVDAGEITLNTSGERVYNDEPFTGEVRSYYQSGELASSDQFVDGRRQGHSMKWFDNGVLGSEVYYENSRREGFVRTWWVNGNQRSEAFYLNGKKEGVAWSWHRSGAKFKRSNYSEGRATGIQQGWRENGDLFSNFEYKNGRIYGLNNANTCMGVEDETISPDYYQDQSS